MSPNFGGLLLRSPPAKESPPLDGVRSDSIRWCKGRTNVFQDQVSLQSWIDWFALQCKDAEHALVDSATGFSSGEPFERLDAQGELAQRERAFGVQPAGAEPSEVLVRRVFRAVDDAQVLAATAFDGGLDETALAANDEFLRLYDHAFSASSGEFLPPTDGPGLALRVREISREEWRGDQDATYQPGQRLHVPVVRPVDVHFSSVASRWNGASFRSLTECTGQQ
jgi:hypothetical protein